MSIYGELGKLFGGKNPADKANQYIEQIPDIARQYYNPYIERGNKAYEEYDPVISGMTQDPTSYLNKILEGYEPSKGYETKRDEMLRAARNTAAAGGMAGSNQDVSLGTTIVDSLLSQDMQQWLQNVLGIQKTGLAGEQNLMNQGFQASGGLESDLANVLGQQAQYAFQGQREKNQRGQDILKALLGAAGIAEGMPLTKMPNLLPDQGGMFF